MKKVLEDYLYLTPKTTVLASDNGLSDTLSLSALSPIEALGNVELFPVQPGEPTTDQADKLASFVALKQPDLVIAIGGGSTIDLAKAAVMLASSPVAIKAADVQGLFLNHRKKFPLIAIPTTCGSGAEATKSAVLTNVQKKLKRGINSYEALPEVVILDPSLLETLPNSVKIASFLDALTHALESNVGRNQNSISQMFSDESLKLLSVMAKEADGSSIENKNALIGAHLAGKAICNSETGPVHALSYFLSEQLDIPHGSAVGLMLPEVFAIYESTDMSFSNFYRENLRAKSSIFTDQIRNLTKNSITRVKLDSLKGLDVMNASKRSMELSGAIANSPIPWNVEKSLLAYSNLLSKLD
jgi:alcohol dehydrogenase class IV